MASEGDHLHFDVSFARLDEAVRLATQRLEEQFAQYQAEGDTVRAAAVRAQIASVRGPQRNQQEIASETGAVRAENEALARTLALNLEILDAMRLRAEQARALAEMNVRAAAVPEIVLPPTGRRYSSYGETIGQQEAAKAAQAQASSELNAQASARARNVALQEQQLQLDIEAAAALQEQDALLNEMVARRAKASEVGFAAGAAGYQVSKAKLTSLQAPPPGMEAGWTKATQALIRYDTALGEYSGFASRAGLASERLEANLLRLGVVEAQASQQLRRHGALTTEFLSALARGETTVSEFGYQIGATIGKFAGWTTAAAATYGALGAVFEFGKGAADSATGVQRLTRTIEGLDTHKAAAAIRNLSSETNVSIKEAADTIFQFSRSFHNVDDAATVAKLALSAYKLDGVEVKETVKAATAIHQQFGISAQGLIPIFDQLAQGQQKFNARITEQIPLMQRAAGAFKNAGGDIHDFVTLSTVALRTTQLSGSQLGTIFQRAAANFLNPTTKRGQADLETISQLGINTNVFGPGQGGIGKLIEEMIRRSATLNNNQRAQLAQAFAGTGLGGRAAALFGGGGAALLPQVQRELEPSRARGVLDIELQRELRTFSERAHSFVNEIQRMGAAFGQSGILNILGHFISTFGSVGHAIEQVVNLFDQLPGPAKETVEVLTALRLAMLFFSRTRFGSTAPGITRVPGFRPSEDTLARQQLATGNRQVIQTLESDVAAANAKSLKLAATQASLDRQKLAILREAGGVENLTKEQAERVNAISAEIVALQREENVLETERNAQLEALQTAKSRQVGLTAINRNRRYSTEEVAALNAKVNSAAGATEEAAASTVAGASLLSRFGSGVTGLIAALDPWLLAIVALPFAFEGVKSLIHHIEGANRKVLQAIDPTTVTAIAQLQQATQRAQQSVAHGPRTVGPSLGGFNPFSEDEDSYDARRQAAAAVKNLNQAIQRARQQTFASPVHQVDFSIAELTSELQADTKAFQEHKISKQEYTRRVAELKRSASASLDVQFAKSNKDAAKTLQAFGITLSTTLAQALADTAKGAKSFLDALEKLNDSQLEKQVQAYAARADVYGLGGGDLQKAGETYLYLAAKFRASKDPKGLQLVQQAQSAFTSAINKNAQDLLRSAQTATTFQGESAASNRAVSSLEQMKQKVQQWVDFMDRKFRKYPAIIKAVNNAAKQIDASINDQLKSAIDQQLQAIQTNAQLQASRIQGNGPQADIQRAEITLNGLRQALAKARAEHADWATIAQLMISINDAARQIVQQRIDNARSVLEAQNQLATSSILGSGPQADIARAQSDLGGARRLLAFDRSHGATQQQILQDQAQVNDNLRSLNDQIRQRDQQIHQDLAAFIASEAALAESQTLDPVKQARIELQAAIRTLATIHPGDFQSRQEYVTALNNARAKINQQRNSLNEAIVTQDLDNLRFEHDIHQIGDQQYINGLRHILATKKLALATRHQILEEIYNLEHGTGDQLDLNVGNIKFPSVYQIRRAIGLGQRGELPGAQNTVINHSAVVNVYVNGTHGAEAVGRVLDRHLGTSVTSAMRAKGVIG